MRIAELIDTVTETIGYKLRVRSGGDSARLKDAELQSPPGYYARPHDANENTVGTDDVVLLEIGDYRLVLCSHNSTGWKRLLEYMDNVWTRAMDKGEVVISREDGTARAFFSVRPNGELRIRTDNGVAAPGDKTMEIVLDPATGNAEVSPGGTTPGLIRLGGAAATFHLIQEETLKAWYDTIVGNVKAIVDGHGHVYTLLGAPTISSVPVAGGIPAVPPGVFSPLPAWPACQMTSPRGD